MRVALVYDRINKIGGAEQVLIAFSELYPGADWYTSFWNPVTAPFSLNWRIHTSWLNKIPLLRNHHEWFVWAMPFIFESFDLRAYDLVVSIGSAESKGVITSPTTTHINYCLTPTRYLYSHQGEYLSNNIFRWVGNILRKWDMVASTRPDKMIAISTQVKNRIKKYYNREVDIIFPPVDTVIFSPTNIRPTTYDLPTNYFLVVSRLVAYKKIDVLIRAANMTKSTLVIVGIGSEYSKLKAISGHTVQFLGQVTEADLVPLYQNALAYLQANEEDFGISMCESLASGRPVIAYGVGGAVDIVIPGKNGILLKDNTIESFAKALKEFDTMSYVAADCIASVAKFDQSIWKQNIKERIDTLCRQTKT